MLAECAMGHTENLSHEELFERLSNDDFECREEGCAKKMSYPIDERFWDKYHGKVMEADPRYRK